MAETDSGTIGMSRIFADAQRVELLAALHDVYQTRHGLAVVTGPRGSGLTTLMRAFAQKVRAESVSRGELSVAIVDASSCTVAGLLCELLSAFGYELPEATQTELLSMTQLIAQHQAQAGMWPLVVFEHVNRASPKVLALINELASLRHARRSACCIVLTGGERVQHIVTSEGMCEVGKRISLQTELTPFTQDERRGFVQHVLEGLGIRPAPEVLAQLARLGDGWPGSGIRAIRDVLRSGPDARKLLPDESLRALESGLAEPDEPPVIAKGDEDTHLRAARPAHVVADTTPGDATPASGSALGELLVSHNGKLVQRFPINRRKVLIGRASHNDIVLDSKWVSRYHAIIVCRPDGASLVDINSTNGMTINSSVVRQGALLNNDVLVIGDYRIKYLNAAARERTEEPPLSETRILRRLDAEKFGLPDSDSPSEDSGSR